MPCRQLNPGETPPEGQGGYQSLEACEQANPLQVRALGTCYDESGPYCPDGWELDRNPDGPSACFRDGCLEPIDDFPCPETLFLYCYCCKGGEDLGDIPGSCNSNTAFEIECQGQGGDPITTSSETSPCL
jgi:hypothetical protein